MHIDHAHTTCTQTHIHHTPGKQTNAKTKVDEQNQKRNPPKQVKTDTTKLIQQEKSNKEILKKKQANKQAKKN